jgi:hypothetical protein
MRRAMVVAGIGVTVAVVTAGLAQQHHTPAPAAVPVTQDNIDRTICVRGWTATVRPSQSYTGKIKDRLIAGLPPGLPHERSAYELDHWMPLELGGAPSDPGNLILELRRGYGGLAETKDVEENDLHDQVCHHKISLAAAQARMAADWPRTRFP